MSKDRSDLFNSDKFMSGNVNLIELFDKTWSTALSLDRSQLE